MADPIPPHVRVRGAREHNLKNIDVDIPRDALVVFTGISGSGKSSLAFGTLYAEAQRRYFESVAPYARRLIEQVGVPDVDSIEGLPPAVALRQQRGTPGARSSVGSVTTLSSLLRMLYSRAGSYPPKQPMLYAEDFSPNTAQGACPACHGLGSVYEVTERSMVPDDSLTIRERAVAAWPPAWHGQNLRDILVTLGYDVDTPWRDLPRKDRQWILFTDEQPTVPVYAGFSAAETRAALRRKLEPSYQGTFMGARKYVLHTFATTQSAAMKKRASRFMLGRICPTCDGKRLKREALSVTFAGLDIGALSNLPLARLAEDSRACLAGTIRRCVEPRRTRSCRCASGHRAARRRGRFGTRGRARRTTDTQPVGRKAHRGATHRVRRARTREDADRPRTRLPVARSNHADAVAGRAAAPASGHAAAVQPVRRRVRARRAVGRTAPRRRSCADHCPRPSQAIRQFVVRGRARPRCDATRRLARRRRAGRRVERRARSLQRPAIRTARDRRFAHPTLSVRIETASRASDPRPVRLDRSGGHHAQQPSRTRRAHSSRRAHGGHGGLGLRQIEPRRAGTGGPRRCPSRSRRAARRRGRWRRADAGHRDGRPHRRRHRCDPKARARGPETDRSHAALEPRDLHRALRPGQENVRRHEGREVTSITTPAVSRSTSRRAAARPAKAKASSPSSCCSCPACTRPAPRAAAPASTRRRSPSPIARRTSPRCWP